MSRKVVSKEPGAVQAQQFVSRVSTDMGPRVPDRQTPETKKCPYCAETVKIEAVKCKHCGSMLEPQKYPQLSTAQPPAVDTVAGTVKSDVIIEGVVAFQAGEQVDIAGISPDPNRPEYCYVVRSDKVNKQFRLSDRELRR